MTASLVGLGSNKRFARQSPCTIVARAAAAVAGLGAAARLSRLYRSAAWPDPSGPPYVNAVMLLETALTAPALLSALLAIEAGFGRQRSADPALRYAPRTLDLDLLDHGGEVREDPDLVLPHPRLGTRAFVLLPLSDVAPGWRHPGSGESVATLIGRLPDRAETTALPVTG